MEPLYPPSATWKSAGGTVMNGIGLTGVFEIPTGHSSTDTLDLSLSIN